MHTHEISLADLTEADLREASRVLRHASLVVEHSGWGRGNLVESATGGVCAHGAVLIAEGLPIETRKSLLFDRIFVLSGPAPGSPGFVVSPAQRALASGLLPMMGKHPGPCIWRDADPKVHTDAAIYCYNDHVCEGGPELIELLLKAADKADKLGEVKRRLAEWIEAEEILADVEISADQISLDLVTA
jgi:hypothetical protein